MKLIAAFVLTLPALCFALEPLEIAGKEAAEKCRLAGVDSFTACTELAGKGAEKSAARQAVFRALTLKVDYIHECEKRKPLQSCLDAADWLLAAGLSADTAHPSPRR